MANKIIDQNLLKAKLGIFIKKQVATSGESLWKEATNSLRITDLNFASV